MEDLSILNINDKLRIIQDDVLEIINNTNQFATHMEKSDSERQKLKNEIISNVEQINKNYEQHIPRHSTPFNEERLSVKGGAIEGHEVYITLNIERPYPPVIRRPAYPASPRAREALEKHIQELIQLGVLRKVGPNEEVEVKAPVIIALQNDQSRMIGDFRALNTYKFPRIQETLTQLSKAKYIKSMDALKGFHQNVLMPKTRKLLRNITHCGIYEYLGMPFCIKNAPSHYQIMMNTILPTELS
ncbi:hypothetical protein O181_055649 [Austropuccinia psidii MF-1]|uniref:Reverse transcriptase domain-containing protein n=1 Tax=Austropuccinia psidii MF-1 TaxID=1389203 RepID=A0A9Q3HUV1_9BASI|nr:hypothetical protein [Austropuccinia psidii MF-1]